MKDSNIPEPSKTVVSPDDDTGRGQTGGSGNIDKDSPKYLFLSLNDYDNNVVYDGDSRYPDTVCKSDNKGANWRFKPGHVFSGGVVNALAIYECNGSKWVDITSKYTKECSSTGGTWDKSEGCKCDDTKGLKKLQAGQEACACEDKTKVYDVAQGMCVETQSQGSGGSEQTGGVTAGQQSSTVGQTGGSGNIDKDSPKYLFLSLNDYNNNVVYDGDSRYPDTVCKSDNKGANWRFKPGHVFSGGVVNALAIYECNGSKWVDITSKYTKECSSTGGTWDKSEGCKCDDTKGLKKLQAGQEACACEDETKVYDVAQGMCVEKQSQGSQQALTPTSGQQGGTGTQTEQECEFNTAIPYELGDYLLCGNENSGYLCNDLGSCDGYAVMMTGAGNHKGTAYNAGDYFVCNGEKGVWEKTTIVSGNTRVLQCQGFGGTGQGQTTGGASQPTMTTPLNTSELENNFAASVAKLESIAGRIKTTVWKDTEGNFNTSRLISDSVAGVVLGTAGGLITSSVVKKSQVKNGFEDINCTVGGQVVSGWGDQFNVGIQ